MPATTTRRRCKGKGRSQRGRPFHRFNIQGRRFGDLFALRPHSYIPDLGWIWEMRCDCQRDCPHHEGRRCGRRRFVFARERHKVTRCSKCTGKGRDVHHYENLRHRGRRGRPQSQVTASNLAGLLDGFDRRERELFDYYMGRRTREGAKGMRNMIACAEMVLLDRRKAGN